MDLISAFIYEDLNIMNTATLFFISHFLLASCLHKNVIISLLSGFVCYIKKTEEEDGLEFRMCMYVVRHLLLSLIRLSCENEMKSSIVMRNK